MEQYPDSDERDAPAPGEFEESSTDQLPHDEVDLVGVYLAHIGRRRLLTAAREQEIGRRIEVARAELLARLAAIPAARKTLLSLATP